MKIFLLALLLFCAPALGALAQTAPATAPVKAKDKVTTASLLAAVKGPQTEEQKIEYLIRSIEVSGLGFIRNGTAYDSVKAAAHLREKWDYSRKRPRLAQYVATARDFIKNIASASSLSKKPYQIVLKDGKQIPSGEWLTKRLEKLEKKVKVLATAPAATPQAKGPAK